ncbi:MAG TPA: hypothetical protein EYQ00_04805 [Dehalococcoidia bacterium]|nr:hypothetical protein [Dehalococcoidia bacterium]
MDSLKAALAGDTACQKAVFEEPLKSQLRTILEENGHWQTTMYDKLTDMDANENNRSSSKFWLSIRLRCRSTVKEL